MMWKDWGFAQSLFSQVKMFLEFARDARDRTTRDGHIRAAIIFALMAFEAYFMEVARGYIGQRKSDIDGEKLKQVEEEQKYIGIRTAVRTWPELLTGQSLNRDSKIYKDWENFVEYRNALLHGDIVRQLDSSKVLAQDVETIENAAHARDTIAGMIKVVAEHFEFDLPTWV